MTKRAVALGTGGQPVKHWAQLLFARGLNVFAVSDLGQLRTLAESRRVDAAIVGLPVDDPGAVLQAIASWRRLHPRLAVGLVARRSSEELVLAALRAGAADFLREPVSDADFLAAVERLTSESLSGVGVPVATHGRGGPLVGESRAIQDVRSYVERVARADTNVLITGETGVGKELVAEMVHSASPRSIKPCVSINCAAIPDTLLESELFGFERGAFTGADRGREGTLRSADGGTIFFDEVGDMGLGAQAKILRAIEAREVHPLGGGTRVPLDVRIIAATNQDLEELVRDGKFRKDLYYRLNVARIHLPPLRQRLDDLEPLLAFYIRQFNRRFGRQVRGLTPQAIEQLRRHDWPGNIRELKNFLEAVFVNLDGQPIDFIDLPDAFRSRLAHPCESDSERKRLVDVLFSTNWNKSKAAEELHWSRMTLYRKLAKYHVLRDGRPGRKPA